MNKTPIEWCDYTWNPVTGCFHSCRDRYCYNTLKATSPLNRFGSRYISDGAVAVEKKWKDREDGKCHAAVKGEIYPYGFDPTFYPHRLDEPLKVKKPSRIFVVDTGDLFGKWVPKEWIDKVLEITKRCSRHDFLFLTKNPGRYAQFDFPDNAWLGTSVNTGKDWKRVETLKKARAKVRYLSIEPLLGEIDFPLDGLQWIIVGAQTGKNAPKPDRRWVDGIVSKAKDCGVPIFVKDNIASFCETAGREFPSIGLNRNFTSAQ